METGEGVEEIKSFECQKCFQVGNCNNSLIRSSEEHIRKNKNPRNRMLNSSRALRAVPILPRWQTPLGVGPLPHSQYALKQSYSLGEFVFSDSTEQH